MIDFLILAALIFAVASLGVLFMGDGDDHPLQEKEMEMIFNLVSWITIIVTVASLIAASTPTPTDDVWIGKLYKLIDWAALNIGKAKEK